VISLAFVASWRVSMDSIAVIRFSTWISFSQAYLTTESIVTVQRGFDEASVKKCGSEGVVWKTGRPTWWP
jgi:hypothetical protein